MDIIKHLTMGIILSLIFYPFFNYLVIILFFSSFIFDVDHYIEYMIRKKDFSIIKAYKEAQELNKKQKALKQIFIIDVLHIFHTIEFIIILGILSLFSKLFLMVLIGLLFHNLLDIIEMSYYKTFKSRSPSIILWLIKHNGEKNKWQQRWARFNPL